MQPEMTEQEHKMAWAIYSALGALRKGGECAASCGCDNDPIVVIVKAMRQAGQSGGEDVGESNG